LAAHKTEAVLIRIPNKVHKIAIIGNTKEFVDMYNACLTEGVFTSRWKTQRLVLIPKGGKAGGGAFFV